MKMTQGSYKSVRITDWTGTASCAELAEQARRRYDGLRYDSYAEPERRKVVRAHNYSPDWE